MKNIYKTIIVWLLTAVLGSSIIWAMSAIDGLKSRGRFDWKEPRVVGIAALAGFICLTISIPAMIIYHFLAMRLYSHWQNITVIKLMLCVYVVCVTFTTVFALGFCVNDAFNPLFYRFSIPYMIAACLMVLLFRYHPDRKSDFRRESISQSSNQTS